MDTLWLQCEYSVYTGWIQCGYSSSITYSVNIAYMFTFYNVYDLYCLLCLLLTVYYLLTKSQFLVTYKPTVTVQYSKVQYSTIQYSTVQCSAI